MSTVRKKESKLREPIKLLPMDIHHRVIIKREWLIVRDAEDGAPRLVPHAPYILAIGDKSPEFKSGVLNDKSAFPLSKIPRGKSAKIICLVPEKITPAFEKLVDDKGVPTSKLTWSRIFRLRSQTVAPNPTDGQKIDTKAVDTHLETFLEGDDLAGLKKLKRSALAVDAPSAKPDVADLESRLSAAAAFAFSLSKRRRRKLTGRRVRKVGRFVKNLPRLKSDYRLAMAFGRLLHESKNPNVIHVASQHLVWCAARAVNRKKAALLKKTVPPQFLCLWLGLKLAHKSVDDGQHPKGSGQASQLFPAYALALSYQILATTSKGDLTDAKRAFAETTLKQCYKVCSRQTIDDSRHSADTLLRYKRRLKGAARRNARKKVNKVRWGFAPRYPRKKPIDWKPSQQKWRVKTRRTRYEWNTHRFLRTLMGNRSASIPMGIPGRQLKIVDVPRGRKAHRYYGHRKVDDCDRQSYYVFRIVRSISSVLGAKAFSKGSFLDQELKKCTVARNRYAKMHLSKKYGAGRYLQDLKLRQRKLVTDMGRREEVCRLGNFGSGDAQLRALMKSHVRQGQRRLRWESRRLERECSRYVEFLSTPQVQGLVGGQPQAVRKAWRTKAMRPFEPFPFLGGYNIGLRYLQFCVQPNVWNAKKAIPQPLWRDELDTWKAPRKPYRVGWDLLVWSELFGSLDHYSQPDYKSKVVESFKAALGLPAKSKAIEKMTAALLKVDEANDYGPTAKLEWSQFLKCWSARNREKCLPIIDGALRQGARLKLLAAGGQGPKPKIAPRRSVFCSEWGGRPLSKSNRARCPDWLSYNRTISASGLNRQQFMDGFTNLVTAQHNFDSARSVGKNNKSFLKTLLEFQLLATLNKASLSAAAVNVVTDTIGQLTKSQSARLGGLLLTINKAMERTGPAVRAVARVLSPLTKILGKGTMLLGSWLGPLGFCYTVYLSIDTFGSYESSSGQLWLGVGLVAGAVATLAVTMKAFGSAAAWVGVCTGGTGAFVLLLITIASLVGVWCFGNTPALNAALELGYAKRMMGTGNYRTEEWEGPLILPGYEFVLRGSRFHLVLYWPKAYARVDAVFYEKRTLGGYDNLYLDKKLSTMQGRWVSNYICHVDQGQLNKLTQAAYGRRKANPEGLELYPILEGKIASRGDLKKYTLPTQVAIPRGDMAGFVEVGHQPTLSYKKLSTGNTLFLCTVGRPLKSFEYARCRLGLGECGKDGQFKHPARSIGVRNSRGNFVGWTRRQSVEMGGQHLMVFSDDEITGTLKWLASRGRSSSPDFTANYQLPYQKHPRRTNSLEVSWGTTGKVTRVTDPNTSLVFKNSRKGWQGNIKWDTRISSPKFELWMRNPILKVFPGRHRLIKCASLALDSSHHATLPAGLLQSALKKVVNDGKDWKFAKLANGHELVPAWVELGYDSKGWVLGFMHVWQSSFWTIEVDKQGVIHDAYMGLA
jgi:hypothetical protein